MSTVIDSIMSQLDLLPSLPKEYSSSEAARELVLDLINTAVSSIDITEHIPLRRVY